MDTLQKDIVLLVDHFRNEAGISKTMFSESIGKSKSYWGNLLTRKAVSIEPDLMNTILKECSNFSIFKHKVINIDEYDNKEAIIQINKYVTVTQSKQYDFPDSLKYTILFLKTTVKLITSSLDVSYQLVLDFIERRTEKIDLTILDRILAYIAKYPKLSDRSFKYNILDTDFVEELCKYNQDLRKRVIMDKIPLPTIDERLHPEDMQPYLGKSDYIIEGLVYPEFMLNLHNSLRYISDKNHDLKDREWYDNISSSSDALATQMIEISQDLASIDSFELSHFGYSFDVRLMSMVKATRLPGSEPHSYNPLPIRYNVDIEKYSNVLFNSGYQSFIMVEGIAVPNDIYVAKLLEQKTLARDRGEFSEGKWKDKINIAVLNEVGISLMSLNTNSSEKEIQDKDLKGLSQSNQIGLKLLSDVIVPMFISDRLSEDKFEQSLRKIRDDYGIDATFLIK